ncbi:hypothetical protein [Cronobacter turicensis]|uniref:hypothetical protein n=1 Tax=Cronobacter turicensis TaxID=413502 RepID=UPI003570E5CA
MTDTAKLKAVAEKAKDNFIPSFMVSTRDVLELIAALEAAQRVAELETRTVKLPPCVDDMHGVGMVMSADAVTEALSAAGINLETGGE